AYSDRRCFRVGSELPQAPGSLSAPRDPGLCLLGDTTKGSVVLPALSSFCSARDGPLSNFASPAPAAISVSSHMIRVTGRPHPPVPDGCCSLPQRRAAVHVTRRTMLSSMAASLATLPAPLLADLAHAPATPAKPFLFRDFQLFDGRRPSLR